MANYRTLETLSGKYRVVIGDAAQGEHEVFLATVVPGDPAKRQPDKLAAATFDTEAEASSAITALQASGAAPPLTID